MCYTIIDSPPGTACNFVATVEHCDYVILVAEAGPFGLNDLKLAIEVVLNMGISFGVVINRVSGHSDLVQDYCKAKGYDVLLCIPENRIVAETYARGGTLLDAMPNLKPMMHNLLEMIDERR